MIAIEPVIRAISMPLIQAPTIGEVAEADCHTKALHAGQIKAVATPPASPAHLFLRIPKLSGNRLAEAAMAHGNAMAGAPIEAISVPRAVRVAPSDTKSKIRLNGANPAAISAETAAICRNSAVIGNHRPGDGPESSHFAMNHGAFAKGRRENRAFREPIEWLRSRERALFRISR